MWNCNTSNKKIINSLIFIFVIILFSFNLPFGNIYNENKSINIAYSVELSENDESNSDEIEKEISNNINEILKDIDSEELDDFIENDFNLDFFSSFSFIKIVKQLLSGDYFTQYDGLITGILSCVKENFKNLFFFFISLFVIVVLYEIFNSFCSGKYQEFKKIVGIVFSLILSLMIIVNAGSLTKYISSVIEKIFNFSRKLFPILLSLILLSGANVSHSITSTISVFLIETGSNIFIYVLFPIVSSILILTILNHLFSSDRFSQMISFLKTLFKYIIVAFFGIFGLFSTVNTVSSSFSDGLNYKITKTAIKNYVPVLGNYVSDGFDFVRTCSILVKNSFGICGIFVLFFIVIKPILLCFVYVILFKLISVLTSFIGNDKFANYFQSISSCISYFIAILVGIFMCFFIFIYLIIMYVSVL